MPLVRSSRGSGDLLHCLMLLCLSIKLAIAHGHIQLSKTGTIALKTIKAAAAKRRAAAGERVGAISNRRCVGGEQATGRACGGAGDGETVLATDAIQFEALGKGGFHAIELRGVARGHRRDKGRRTY
uniref:Uncharacterized protein n=1 Tax=Oryza sativa subsp. japonica TaxID=39947 RepID=Q8H864_ORYSJ|nr:hypothetical protein [Oryza sativa Japonica Group]